jgi:hypothetical protein
MNALWSYFWPCFALGLIAGGPTGLIGFRRRSRSRRNLVFAAGAVLSMLLAALWHGPIGGAASFEARVQRGIQANLVYYEMTRISAHLHHGPLTRTVMLSGPANDFQRENLAAILEEVPGVASATWSSSGGGIPLIVEGMAAAIVGFLSGLVLAYVAELRRRYNAQWKW